MLVIRFFSVFIIMLFLISPNYIVAAEILDEFNQVGFDGDTGSGGFGGYGGYGGKGGGKNATTSEGMAYGEDGRNGEDGGVGFSGQNGGLGVVTITSSFFNTNVVQIGGQGGLEGQNGQKGKLGGNGGRGAHWEWLDTGFGVLPFYAFAWAGTPKWGGGGSRGRSLIFHPQGFDARPNSGAGGGGGMEGGLFHRNGYWGGDGAQGNKGENGSGGTGGIGLPSPNRSKAFSEDTWNYGFLQIGGNGGNGGDGGNGGQGGGGGGGQGARRGYIYWNDGTIRFMLNGGDGGEGGNGGAGGKGGRGGKGSIVVSDNGMLYNGSTGTVLVGSKQGSSHDEVNGSLHVKSGGSLHNEGQIDAQHGHIITESGSQVINNGFITIPSFSNHGTLTGAGVFVGDLNNLGTFSPGNSIGNVDIFGNFTENSLLEIELAGTSQHDFINVYGDVSFGINSILGLDFYGSLNESMLNNNDHFDLLRYTGCLSGEFGSIDDLLAILDFGQWDLDYSFVLDKDWQSVRLTYTASNVPVPATMILFGLGLTMLVGVSRRKMK